MSSSLVCWKCANVNVEGAKFCVRCGSSLPDGSATLVPVPSFQTAFPSRPGPVYDYAAAMAAQQKTREVDRTKTGLLLLMTGIIIGPIPYVQIIGSILVLIGAIMVILGRKAFGPEHSRNVMWSVIIYIVGICVVVAGAIGFAVALVGATISGMNGTTPSSTLPSQSLAAAFDTLLILAAVGAAIIGIAQVLFSYALQQQTGKILLWAGYAASIGVAVIEFLIISPLIANAAAQSFVGSTYDPVPFADLQTQLRIVQLLAFIPAIFFAAAIYLVWSRINAGQLPAPGGASGSF
jgi:MFS family permease